MQTGGGRNQTRNLPISPEWERQAGPSGAHLFLHLHPYSELYLKTFPNLIIFHPCVQAERDPRCEAATIKRPANVGACAG